MAFSLGNALKGLGGLFKAGGEGGDFAQGRSLFDFMGNDAMGRVGKGLDSLAMARSFADGDYGAAFGLLSDMKRKRKEEERRRNAGMTTPRDEGFSPHGLGGGIY